VKLGGDWHHLPSCASTNDEALRLGRAGAAEGTVVTAEAQERGRGRLGRLWYSPPGDNLYLSVLLRPPLPPPRAPFLTLCAGVALAEAATAALGAVRARLADPPSPPLGAAPLARLKWPNDLLLGAPGGPLRKAGGVLTELVCSGSRIDFVVVGIGVNVNCRQFPPELQATSLLGCLPAACDRLSVPGFAAQLLAHLQARYEQFLAEGQAPIQAAFTRLAAYLGEPTPITVHAGDRTLRGVPLGLAEDGALLLRDDRDQVCRVVAGEIVSQLGG
jgi:BirA family biotin operon repressor/biotin-[acetyl-CoA-carboxylase] ligase